MKRRTILHAASWATAMGFTSRIGMSATETGVLALLEDTPREQLPALLVDLIHQGRTREDLTAALATAVARNVQPYPDVGFKYHAFMVLHALQVTMDNLDDSQAWLPLIWAADYFKRVQAEERQASGWRMPDSAGSGTADKEGAHNALLIALERWDPEAADAAISDYARLATRDEVFAVLFRYGARDQRAIGHKAITVQNAHRLMSVLGAEQTEPVLRSTVAALLNTGDDSNPAQADFSADRPWREHQTLLTQIPDTWRQGRLDQGARGELLQALRQVSELEAGQVLAAMLQAGIAPETAWEALFAAGAELVMRRPAVVPVHAVTSINALHYAYRTVEDDSTRQLMLLQAAAFIPMFRRLVGNASADLRIDAFERRTPQATGAETVDEILADAGGNDGLGAAGKALQYLADGGSEDALMAAARRNLARNADETHAYKFAEAAFESRLYCADAEWRNRLLAGSMVYMSSASVTQRNPAVAEAMALLGV